MTWRQKQNTFKLSLNGIPFDIDEPEGFTDLESIIERDRDAHGTFFEYTPAEYPLRFTGIAKSLLRAQFDNYGVDAQAAINFQTGVTFGQSYEIGYKIYKGTATGLSSYDLKAAQTFTIDEAGTISAAYMFLAELGILFQPEHNIRIVLCETQSGTPSNILQIVENVYDTRNAVSVDGIWVGSDEFNTHVEAGVYAIYVQAVDDGGSGMTSIIAEAYFNRNGSGYSGGNAYVTSAEPWTYSDWALQGGSDFDFKIAFYPDPTPIFSGAIDFSQAKDNQNYFSCTILRSDLLIKLRNNIDKKINLLSGTDIYGNYSYPITEHTIGLHSFVIKKQWEAKTNNTDQIIEGGDSDWDAYVIYGGLDDPTKEEFSEYQSVAYEFLTDSPGDNTVAFWVAEKELGDCIVTVDYDWDYFHWVFAQTSGGSYLQTVTFRIDFYDENNNLKRGFGLKQYTKNGTLLFGEASELSGNDSGTLQTTESVSVNAGDYILARVVYDVTGTITSSNNLTSYGHTTNSLTVNVTVDTVAPPSTAKCLLIGDAIEQNIRMITGRSIPFDSDFFTQDGCGYSNIVTNGYQLRGIDKPILASFSDLFHKGVQPIFGLGYSVEESKIKMELWEYFYQDVELIDLGEVGDYEEEVLGGDIFNQCTFGFSTFANDENLASTLDDVHTEGSWNTPIENVAGLFEKKSDFILSSFLIEQTRRLSLTEKPTVSNRYDDKLFMIAIEKDYTGADFDFRAELSDVYQLATNMENIDTAYNLRHTVKRMLLNWGVWINSFAFRYESDDSELINLYFLNNGDLVTQFPDTEECSLGDTEFAELTERGDVGKLDIQQGEAKFDQVKITFTKQLSQEELDVIRDAHDGDLQVYQGRYGYIKCLDYNGISQTGWLLKLSTNIYSNLGKFELIKRHRWILRSVQIDYTLLPFAGYHIVGLGGISALAQYFYVPAGKLREIYIYSVSYVAGLAITIQRAGGDSNFWTGIPEGTEVVYRKTNYTLFKGKNTIILNKDITDSDLYVIRFIYLSSIMLLEDVNQTDPTNDDQVEIMGAYQLYSTYWEDPIHNKPIRFGYTYDYDVLDIRTIGITGVTVAAVSINHNDDEIGQQIRIHNDGIFREVQIWWSKTGNPIGTFDCVLSTPDGSGFPDTDIDAVQFSPVDNNVTTIIFNTTVLAGDYIIWFRYNDEDTLITANRWNARYVPESSIYLFGNYIVNNGGGGWAENTSYRLMMKYKYEPS